MPTAVRACVSAISISSLVLLGAASAAAQSAQPVSAADKKTSSNATRNLALVGLGGGLIVALATDICGNGRPYGSTQEPACISAKPALYMGAGAAIGALIGHAIDSKRQQAASRTPTRTVLIAPQVRKAGAGVAVMLTW